MRIIIEEKQKELSRVYPYLGENESWNVVAFTAPKTGVVVLVGTTTKWEQGEVLDVLEESTFTPMHQQPEPEPKPIPVKDRKYPYVGIDELGQSVLFTAPYVGMLIKKEEETEWPIGDCSNEWAEYVFTPIPVSRIIIDLE